MYSNGGAVFLEGYCSGVRFVNCTMIDNEAVTGDGGGVEIAFSDASFTNCIIYNNNGGYSDNIYLDYGNAEVNYCNTPFPDGAAGTDNIDEDAQFVNPASGNFYLSETSPCIDTGIDSLTITDANNNEITVIDLDPDEYYNTAPDMGYFEYGMPDKITKIKNHLTEIYPNPTNNLLIIQSEKEIKSIVIYDLSGKNINSIRFDSNKKRIIDVSDLKNGIYFINLLMTDKSVISEKVIILK